MNDVATLQRALNRMPPRLMLVLVQRFIEPRTPAEFATLYGLDEPHAELLVFKAARSLDAALAGQPEPGPIPLDQEWAGAKALSTGLPPHLADLVSQKATLTVALQRAALEAEASPARAREEWLRKIAIALVLGLAAYFYWRDHYAQKEWRYEPRPAVPTSVSP